MKILQIPDSPWSIGKLCEYIREGNKDIDWTLHYVPPRDIVENVPSLREEIKSADIVNFEYWNVAWQLCEFIPELEGKKKILTYHTMPNKKLDKWGEFDALVVKTNAYYEKLNALYPGKVYKIENVPDTSYFKWIEDYKSEEKSVGYCGRIVEWKGLKEIAQACYELGYKLYVMGRHDKADYWHSIPEEHKRIMDFSFFGCKDANRMDFYKKISVYVGNCEPDHEAGTLPFLEALVCGVPIVTTPNGMAADIVEDEKDVLLFEYNNVEQIKEKLQRVMNDNELRNKLRENGRIAISKFTPEYLANKYKDLFNKVMSK